DGCFSHGWFGEQPERHIRIRSHADDQREVWWRSVLRRRRGYGREQRRAAADDGHDARGLGESDVGEFELAGPRLQGKRQLLPDGDDGLRAAASGGREVWR